MFQKKLKKQMVNIFTSDDDKDWNVSLSVW